MNQRHWTGFLPLDFEEKVNISDLVLQKSRWTERNIALASAADLSLLEISSRTVGSKETWSLIIKVSLSV